MWIQIGFWNFHFDIVNLNQLLIRGFQLKWNEFSFYLVDLSMIDNLNDTFILRQRKRTFWKEKPKTRTKNK